MRKWGTGKWHMRKCHTTPEPIHYRLLTLTYGMNCAPYFTLRRVAQLARDEGPRFLKAADVLLQDTYVDDVLTGASIIEEVVELRNLLTKWVRH